MERLKTLTSTVFVASLFATSGCSMDATGTGTSTSEIAEQEVESATQAIIGGAEPDVNWYDVAVYVHGYSKSLNMTGWLGLCSGTYLGTIDGWAIVTTADHCRADGDDYRVTTDAFPGKAWERPPAKSPPPNLSAPAWFVGDWWAHPDKGYDQALIMVQDTPTFRSGLSGGPANVRPGLTFMSESAMSGSSFTVDGYGAQNKDTEPPTGLLKRGTGFTYSGPSSAPNIKISSAKADAILGPGDSGGGIIKLFSYYDNSRTLYWWPVLAGIVQSTAGGVATNYIAEMVQAWIGSLTVSPLVSPTSFMRINAYPSITTPDVAERVYYDSANKLLSNAARTTCLNSDAAGVPCNANDASQRFTHTANLQLKSDKTGKCVDPYAPQGHLQMVTCRAVAQQAWVFRIGVQ